MKFTVACLLRQACRIVGAEKVWETPVHMAKIWVEKKNVFDTILSRVKIKSFMEEEKPAAVATIGGSDSQRKVAV